MDYVVRDAYHAGTREYGRLDVDRTLDGLLVKDGILMIDESQLESIMNFFHSLFYMYTSVYYHKTCRAFDIALGDALSKMRNKLEEISEEPAELLKWDDSNFLSWILNSNEDAYDEAKKIIKSVISRKKIYRLISRKRFDLPLRWILTATDKGYRRTSEYTKMLENIENLVKYKYPKYSLRFDFRPKIRSVGVNAEDIMDWLDEKVIYNTYEKKAKKLSEANLSDFLVLERINIPISVFMHIDDYKKLTKKQIEELKKELSQFLEEIIRELYQKLWGKFQMEARLLV